MRNQFLTFLDFIYQFEVGIMLLLCIPFLKVDAENHGCLDVYLDGQGLEITLQDFSDDEMKSLQINKD
jgi:hypothetical protein